MLESIISIVSIVVNVSSRGKQWIKAMYWSIGGRGRRPRRPVVRICVKSDSRDVEDDVPYR